MNKTTIMKWMVLPMALMAVACTDYQSSIDELDNRVDGIEQRVAKLESLNSQIAAIQQIVTAQEQAGYITGVAQNANGYQFTMSNGTIISVRDGIDGKDGKDGADGKDGKDGADGKDGKDGVDGQNGKDGVDGKDGKDGVDGKDGKDGVDGKDGKDGQNGKDGLNGQDGHTPIIGVAQDTDGNWYWTVDGEFLLDGTGNKVLANGIGGQNGKDGQDGKDGADGKDGKDGVDGKDGKDGVDGKDGKDGVDGKDGKDGVDGQDGQNGKDGITPQLRINTTTLMWEVSLDNGETWTSLGVKAKGEDGAKGADGADGDAFFKSVTVGETEVTFTLADGVTTFTLPVMDTFKKVRDRVQSIVYIPENLDGMMTLQNGVQTTVRYRVMPEAVATALATNYASTLSFIGEEVAVTRGIASATIAIDGVVNEGNGRLAVSITPSGMTADKGYAFALTMNDGTSMYSTAYTSVFFAIPPVAIGIAADGILAGQGYITVGNTLQLIPLLVPTTTNMKGVEWTTSDANVATVDANGQVIARNNGTATITVTSKAAPTVSKSITITVSDGSITLNTNDLVSQSNAE